VFVTIKINAKRGAAAAATASILLLTGCKTAEATWADGSGGATAPAGASAGLAKDCTAAVTSFKDLFKGMITSAGEPAAARKALTDYATAARGQAAKVSDAALRAAIEKHAAAAQTLSAAADPTALDNADFTSAAGEIEKVCAGVLAPSAPAGAPAVRVGAKGSACPLPVTFDLVALWQPKAVDVDKLGELAKLARNGPFEVVCEVDAKPAGAIGFLRVYVAPGRKGTPRSHLQAFVGAESVEARRAGTLELKNIKVTDVTTGGQRAAEVTYETYSKTLDVTSKYSALALNTAKGAVVVKLAPAGAEEHATMLPAFELARKSLTVNR